MAAVGADWVDIDLPETLCGDYVALRKLDTGLGAAAAGALFLCKRTPAGPSDLATVVRVLRSPDAESCTALRKQIGALHHVQSASLQRVLETFQDGATLYVVLQWLEGQSLAEHFVRWRSDDIKIPLDTAIYIARQLVDAVVDAHQLQDIDGRHLNLHHGSLGPRQIYLTPAGTPRIRTLAFAAEAHSNNESAREANVGYLAPEVLDGKHAGQTADTFSLGAVLFELFTGSPAFAGSTSQNIREANHSGVLNMQALQRAATPAAIEACILQSLAPKPRERFATVAELGEALSAFGAEPAGMGLALSALLRDAATADGEQSVPTAGEHLVCMYSKHEERRLLVQQVAQDAQDDKWWVETYEDADGFFSAWGVGLTPSVVVVDGDSSDFDTVAMRGILSSARPAVPLIVWASERNAHSAQRAYALGAVEFLDRRCTETRLRTALRHAVAHHQHLRGHDPRWGDAGRRRMLLISGDTQTTRRLLLALPLVGYSVDLAQDAAEGLSRASETSHAAVIYDARAATMPLHMFAETYRNLPGMGPTPFVYLTGPDDPGASIAFCTSRARDDSAASIAAALHGLLESTKRGRSFKRASSEFPVEIIYGGERLLGRGSNISRGGTLVRLEKDLPLGALITLALDIGEPSPIRLAGRVMRGHDVRAPDIAEVATALPHERSVALRFEHFVDDGEVRLITHVEALLDEQVQEAQ